MQSFLGDTRITASNETILLVIKFKVGGNLRFLSHAETVKVLQRACVRAGVEIQYSQGFNPRPKLSLPLPRPVGVESDEELLCLRVLVRDGSFVMRRAEGAPDATKGVWERENVRNTQYAIRDTIKAELSAQLPEGCQLVSVGVAEANKSFQPCSVTYVLAIQPEYVNDRLRAAVKRLLASESLNVRRRIDRKNSKLKTQNSKPKEVDVRGFLKSIELDDRCVIVECKVGSAGSIRVEEILKLLELDARKLASPIRRTAVQWQRA